MDSTDKPLVWLHGEVKTPPLSHGARIEPRATWRIIYRIDADSVLLIEVFSKKAAATPRKVIDACQIRLREYDNA